MSRSEGYHKRDAAATSIRSCLTDSEGIAIRTVGFIKFLQFLSPSWSGIWRLWSIHDTLTSLARTEPDLATVLKGNLALISSKFF